MLCGLVKHVYDSDEVKVEWLKEQTHDGVVSLNPRTTLQKDNFYLQM